VREQAHLAGNPPAPIVAISVSPSITDSSPSSTITISRALLPARMSTSPSPNASSVTAAPMTSRS